MNIFDIVGPIMVGPSSSHTAGAVKIGYVARKLMAEPIVDATINMYGSFLATGGGHGTKYAIVAGLLGMLPDDRRIPDSFHYADEIGMKYRFGEADLKDVHPNSVQLILEGEDGRKLEIVGESIGGSLINIAQIDGLSANFSGDARMCERVSSRCAIAFCRGDEYAFPQSNQYCHHAALSCQPRRECSYGYRM